MPQWLVPPAHGTAGGSEHAMHYPHTALRLGGAPRASSIQTWRRSVSPACRRATDYAYRLPAYSGRDTQLNIYDTAALSLDQLTSGQSQWHRSARGGAAVRITVGDGVAPRSTVTLRRDCESE